MCDDKCKCPYCEFDERAQVEKDNIDDNQDD